MEHGLSGPEVNRPPSQHQCLQPNPPADNSQMALPMPVGPWETAVVVVEACLVPAEAHLALPGPWKAMAMAAEAHPAPSFFSV